MNKIELSKMICSRKCDKMSISKKKPKYGVGINDADHKISIVIDGKCVICPAHTCWNDMLKRCYSDKFARSRPTYSGAYVCDEWLKFSSFRNWWLENSVDDYQLDKDILVLGNKVYSPETCIFVPNKFNSLIVFSGAVRGDCRLGVYFEKQIGKYRARCKSQITGRVESLGCFDSDDEAYMAWRCKRLQVAAELKSEMDAIDERIYHGIVNHIINAQ